MSHRGMAGLAAATALGVMGFMSGADRASAAVACVTTTVSSIDYCDFTQGSTPDGVAEKTEADSGLVYLTGATDVARFQTGLPKDYVVGTGVINPFLKFQNSPVEQGYNTDRKPGSSIGDVEFDETASQTNSIQAGNFVKTTISGIDYFKFILDINEADSASTNNDSGPLITIEELQVFKTTDYNIFGATYDETTGFGASATEVYSAGKKVLLDYNWVGGGSGNGVDLVFFLKADLFQDTDYIVLYNKLGKCFSPVYNGGGNYTGCNDTPDTFIADAGPEEWAGNCVEGGCGGAVIPLPAGIWLMLGAMGGLGWLGRRGRVVA